MAGPKPDISYQGYNPSPSGIAETDSPAGRGPRFDVHANPEEMGGSVAQGLEKFGAGAEQASDKASELAITYGRMATEANANDVIANQFAPAAAKLKQNFYSLKGKDALAGEPTYLDSLNDLRGQFLSKANNPYEGQILSTWMARHASQETDGASLYANQQQTDYEDKMSGALLKTMGDGVIDNYNNPDLASRTKQQMDAQIQKHGIDRGWSPEQIDEYQRTQWGTTVKDAVSRAVTNGDVQSGKNLYDSYKDSVTGPNRMEIDKLLHTENMRQFGVNAAHALLTGQPVPNAPIGSPANVKSVVVDASTKNGVDPQTALATASIESDFGQNVGKRGDIGQTGKGGDLPTQAANMTQELSRAKALADTATGRQSDPWEQYVVYQQGHAGGAALLKADPNAKAIDVLKPFYKNPQDAIDAINHNGGNLTMSSGQFLDMIKGHFNSHLQNASFSTPDGKDPAQAFTDAHTDTGLTMQPGATPTQRLMEMDKVYPDALDRANQIPNIDQRNAALEALEKQHTVYQAGAQAYKATLIHSAQQLADNPKFTDVNQIPAEMRSALFSDSPQTLSYLQARSEYNLKHASGFPDPNNSKNAYEAITRTLFENDKMDDPNAITGESQLHSLVGRTDDTSINMKDYNDAKKSFDLSDDWKKFLREGMQHIQGANGDVDGQGKDRAVSWYNNMLQQRDANSAKGDSAVSDADLIKQLKDTGAPHTPSRMEQIENWVKGIFRPNTPQASSSPTAASPTAIPTISSPTDPAFASLPKGAQFRTSDGELRIKH